MNGVKLWLKTASSIWLLSLGISGLIMAYLIFLRTEDFPDSLVWKVLLLLGLCLATLGIYLYASINRLNDEFRINPKWITFFNDFINLVIGILAAFLLINFIMMQLEMKPIEDEEFSLFMGVYYYFLGIPIVAFFTTRLTGQIIKVSNESIESFGIGKPQIMQWKDLKEIKLEEEYIVKGRMGMVLPRKLQMKMIIESKNGEKLIINEPQTKKAKNKLYHTLHSHIPKHLNTTLGDIFSKW